MRVEHQPVADISRVRDTFATSCPICLIKVFADISPERLEYEHAGHVSVQIDLNSC